jgi:hypothetical protein
MSDSSFASSQERFANLNDENFLEWKDNMQGLLMARGLITHVDPLHVFVAGDPAEQKAEEKVEQRTADATWAKDEQKAQGLIFLKVEHQQRVHLLSIKDSARSMWAKICAKHEKVGMQAAMSSISAVFNTRYQDGTKLEDHLVKMRQYLTRMEAAGNVLVEETKVGFMLLSLPPSWAVFKEIHSAATGQTVSSICLATLTERDRRLNEERSAANTLAIAQQLANSPSALAVREQTAATRAANKLATCTWCLKRGHIEEECYRRRDGKPRINEPRADRRNDVDFAPELTIAPTNNAHYVFTAVSATPAAGVWILDTGASTHCCREQSSVDSVQPCAMPHVVSGHGGRMPIVGSGTVTISVAPAARGQPDRIITLTDVCLVPGLATNVVSVARLTETGLDVSFSTSLAVIRHGKQVVAVADLDVASNLYHLRTASRAKTRTAAAVTAPQDVNFVESQLGIKASGATDESALPASLQPELVSINSEDNEPPPLAPASNTLLPRLPIDPLQQPQPTAGPAQAVHQPEPDLAPASAAPAPEAAPPRRPLLRELTELQDANDSGRLDPKKASFLPDNDISRDRARHSSTGGRPAYITALLEQYGTSDCEPSEHVVYERSARMIGLSESSSRGAVSAAS